MTQLELLDELKRRKSKRDDLLREFEIKGELSTGEIMAIAGPGMSSRLKELRRKNHIIVPHHEKDGLWRYTYLGVREDDGTNVSVVD